MRIGWLAAACAFLFFPPALAAQDTTRAAQDSAVRVFLDCPDSFCDFDYYHTEITFVNWVRDRTYAQVHVLVTTQGTGLGQEYTLAFIGQARFAGTADTLRWNSNPSDTQDDIRRGLAGVMRLGLVRFAAHTPAGRLLEISYSAPAGASAQVRDPWNYWVFTASLNGNFNGQKSIKQQYLSGSVSADRLTDTWKTRFSINQSYSQGDFTSPVYDTLGVVVGEQKTRSITRSNNFNSLVVRSVGVHWSIGARGYVSSATYSNLLLSTRIAPAVEYDVVPYSQSTRQLLTFRYDIGPALYHYRDTTIFNRVRETQVSQTLNVSLSIKQPWGSASVSAEGSNYLYDFRKNRVTFFGNGSFRIYKGLSVQMFGSLGLIHDQLSIPRAGPTEQDVLLQRRQLATSYQYFGFFSLQYSFGSKFANIVNPRFEGGGGGFFISN